ncbi:hypothetical protein [Salinibacterium sp.]|uniref:hypothetical protein n=1 Tax=Salinibacterium sp. TaxID=1915057 RepID=UPI00286C5FBB|nr:hypothetical protein [Salinibacterium sp.]
MTTHADLPNTDRTVPGSLVAYESMFGNSHLIAEAIASGLGARVLSIHSVDSAQAAATPLLVMGGPTHVHGLSRPATRTEARRRAEQSAATVTLDVEARGDGLREWLDQLVKGPQFFAAFDTRVDVPELFSGSAATKVVRRLEHLHSRELLPAESFLVDKANRLVDGELDRASAWGLALLTAYKKADTTDDGE